MTERKKENMMKSEEVTRILENAIRIGKGVIRYGSVASYIPSLPRQIRIKKVINCGNLEAQGGSSSVPEKKMES